MALATKTFALSTVPETGVGVQRGVSAGVRGTVLPPAPLRQHGVQVSMVSSLNKRGVSGV